jgi:hypothetical protein
MKRNIILILGLQAVCLSVIAGGERTAAGGRSAAMGGTSAANHDLWSIHNNQAGLAWLKTASAGFAFENRFLMAGITTEVIGLAIPFKIGTAGISVHRYGNNLYNELTAGIAFARKFGKKFSAGVQFDYIRMHQGGEYGNKQLISFEVGLMYQTYDNLVIGMHLVNPVPVKLTHIQEEYLPASLNLGLSYRFSKEFEATVEVEKETQFPPVFRIGTEYQFSKPLCARIGISTNPMAFTFGFGIKTGKLIFDFSSGYHQVLGFSPTGSVCYSFK